MYNFLSMDKMMSHSILVKGNDSNLHEYEIDVLKSPNNQLFAWNICPFWESTASNMNAL